MYSFLKIEDASEYTAFLHNFQMYTCLILILLLTKDAHSFSVYVKGSRMIKTIFFSII